MDRDDLLIKTLERSARLEREKQIEVFKKLSNLPLCRFLNTFTGSLFAFVIENHTDDPDHPVKATIRFLDSDIRDMFATIRADDFHYQGSNIVSFDLKKLKFI